MKLGTIVKWSFIISLTRSVIAAYMKIKHMETADTYLTISILSTLLFIATAIYEVRTSNKIDNFEKTMWTIAFIFLSGITGLIYFFIGRKRIVVNP